MPETVILMDRVWMALLRYFDEKYREAGKALVEMQTAGRRAKVQHDMATFMIRQAEERMKFEEVDKT